ncbi:hypothetical protein LP092_08710 [Moraxella bovis]|uniref:MarR family transcriptional regulator n=1 Tax=Moraxella bovis TaxID=476 RepID=A0ABY6M3J8_MORBO|nr:hypothetical protein [Moraxella bovis]UZA02078.1 hypothetical protein LP092_08710 [Moraxella bovis]
MKTQKQTVLEAVIDLHNKETPASRTTIAKLTGIKQTAVDECLKRLADDELIYRLCSGVYSPVVQHPPQRTIYKTMLPDGTVKLDIGDDVLTLTPKEARTLGGLMYAEATEFGLLTLHHRMMEQENAFHNRLKRLEKEISKQNKPTQGELL